MLDVGQRGILVYSKLHHENPSCSIPAKYFGRACEVVVLSGDGSGYDLLRFGDGAGWGAWEDMLEAVGGPW